jgi:Tol biopolymer transport system component
MEAVTMKKLFLPASICLLWNVCVPGWNASARENPEAKPPYASDQPMPAPAVFGRGVISTGSFDSHPEFTPDGKTLYFLRSAPNFNFWTILVSHFANGQWSTPEVAPFSGQYSDADPFITRDGAQLFFISRRPAAGKAGRDTDIWVMDRTPSGWSEPRNVGVPINSEGDEWYPTVTRDGTLYFGSDRPGGKGSTDLYRSRLVNGKYAPPENLGDVINTQFDEFEPFITADESLLLFMASGRPDGIGGSDLYVSHHRNGAWTKPVNLGDKINTRGREYSPKISPDGKYFFWTSTRNFTEKPLEKRLTYSELMDTLEGPGNSLGDIYQVDLSALGLQHE